MKPTLCALALSLFLSACGMEGPPGPPGPQGVRGEEGGFGIASIYTCNGTRTFGTSKLYFNNARYEFEDGSVMTTCIVNDPLTSYSSTFLYRESNAGAKDASCLVVYDIDTASEGYFQFGTTSAGAGTVKYVDPTSSNNGASVPMTCVRR